MPVRVGINGFGRIGRNVFRAAHEQGADIEWVARQRPRRRQDARPPAQVRLDTTAPSPARSRRTDGALGSTASEIQVLAERDPAQLPWGELGADVVIESTGLFTDRENAAKHLDAGAKKVVISAPATDPDVDRRARRQLRRGLRPRAAPRHLQRLVHDQLPGAGRQGAATTRSGSSTA